MHLRHPRSNTIASIVALAGGLLLLGASGAWASLRVETVGPDEVLGSIATRSGTTSWVSRAGTRLELALSPDEIHIHNPIEVDRFHPFPDDLLRRTLAEMRALPGPPLRLTVYVLPGMPMGVKKSFAVGSEIFLAPALGPWSDEVGAYTLVHELGHGVQNLRAPGRRGDAWRRYLELRGIDDRSVYHDAAPHRDRPGEIFAEDFRTLYGGRSATASRTIENPDLPLAHQVAGLPAFLEDFVAGLLTARKVLTDAANFPNPFNPSTTIRVRMNIRELGPNARVRASVYDVSGRRIADLGSLPVADEVSIRWDGQDDQGRLVASGRYLYRLTVGLEELTGHMLLLK